VTSSLQHYLITGGAGFIGSHMADLLLAAGHHVHAIDNLSTGRASNIEHLTGNARFDFTHASIDDEPTLERLAGQSQVIIHLAAAVGVKLVVEHPVQTIETNIFGTERALKAALRNKCKILIASTSEVYGKGAKFPFHEDDDVLLGATSKNRWGYAASKMVDEFLGLAYAQEFNLDVVLLRLFNTVGVRQTGRYGMVIPRFVRQALNNEPITVYGDGTQQRCFCDVRDTTRAIASLAQNPGATGRVFNIGGTEEVSMLQLARRIADMAGSRSAIKLVPYSEAYQPGFEDMQRRVPDTSRIEALTGWRPTINLDAILRNVITHERARPLG
jgi:UDP-glucose 4-epimerase